MSLYTRVLWKKVSMLSGKSKEFLTIEEARDKFSILKIVQLFLSDEDINFLSVGSSNIGFCHQFQKLTEKQYEKHSLNK